MIPARGIGVRRVRFGFPRKPVWMLALVRFSLTTRCCWSVRWRCSDRSPTEGLGAEFWVPDPSSHRVLSEWMACISAVRKSEGLTQGRWPRCLHASPTGLAGRRHIARPLAPEAGRAQETVAGAGVGDWGAGDGRVAALTRSQILALPEPGGCMHWASLGTGEPASAPQPGGRAGTGKLRGGGGG